MDQRRDPSLSELLDDPIVEALMARDGTTREDVLALLAQVRRSLEDRPDRLAA